MSNKPLLQQQQQHIYRVFFFMIWNFLAGWLSQQLLNQLSNQTDVFDIFVQQLSENGYRGL